MPKDSESTTPAPDAGTPATPPTPTPAPAPEPKPPDPPVEAPAPDADLPPEAMKKELDRARREAASYREKLREREAAEKAATEAERRKKLTAEQRATEAEAKAQAAIAAAETRAQAAERRAELAGKVTNPERVLRLMDDPGMYFPDGALDTAALLRDFPEYAPAAQPAKTPATGAGGGSLPKDPSKLGDAEFYALKTKT